MQQSGYCDIKGVPGLTRDNLATCGRAGTPPAAIVSFSCVSRFHSLHGIGDCPIAGTPTKITLQAAWQVLLLCLIKRRGGHDHSSGAESALETGGVKELFLHRVQFVPVGKPFDGRDFVTLSAEGGNQATVLRVAVDPHGTCATVPAVAALLGAKQAQVPQERPEALPWIRLLFVCLPIHARERRLC